MKISALFIFFLLFNTLNAQGYDILGALNMPKVQINKDLVAYSISYTTMKNGIKSKMKTNNPSTKNPHYIYISSNDKSGKIVIKNKKTTEDLILNFKYIYKTPDNDNSIVYDFLMLNDNYIARYFVGKNGSNDMLFISYQKDSNNSLEMYYTISKI